MPNDEAPLMSSNSRGMWACLAIWVSSFVRHSEIRHSSFLLIVLAWLSITSAHAQIPAEWDAAAETAVVFNPDFPASAELAAYYAKKRGIPEERVIGLRCSRQDSMSRAEFDQQLRLPLLKIFQSRGWWDASPLPGTAVGQGSLLPPVGTSVRVLVLMRGVPFQIRRETQDPKPSEEDEASVDSELTVLGLNQPPLKGGLRNPWFDQPTRFSQAQRVKGLLILGRLDGPDDATVRRMIDDALHAEEHGLFGRAVIDLAEKSGAYQQGEDWLKRSAETYKRYGIPVFVDRSPDVLAEAWPLPDTILYFGWYTGKISGALASPAFRFKRGAIACHLHSFSASAIRSREHAWAGPLLSQGAAVAFGNVYEPYLTLTLHFDVFNKRLLEGFTMGEAAWNATPALSWMSIVLGDPLYRPFGRGVGARLGADGDRDYALYQSVVRRMAAETDSQIKTAITTLAEKRKGTSLLELTALLSALQQKEAEAVDLLEHAETATKDTKDLLRLRLYRAEMLRRAGKADAARKLLRDTLAEDRFKKTDTAAAINSALQGMGG